MIINKIRHIGIYVKDIKTMVDFYVKVFKMSIIEQNSYDEGVFLDKIIGGKNVCIRVTKLITQKGQEKGYGDMIEFIEILSGKKCFDMKLEKNFLSSVHIAFECSDIFKCAKNIELNGGEIFVSPFKRKNGNWLCFCCDPEGNCLELIERIK